jgi:uncharacterized damage-inducible protein DinB
MTEFRDQDITGAHFEHVILRDPTVHHLRLTGAQVRNALIRGGRLRDVELVDIEISGELVNVVVNGVDVGPLVEAELDRRTPERPKMRPDTGDGCREAWAILERLWEDTLARAMALPEAALHECVDDEWSFVQTLRHLSFASAAWVERMVLGEKSPWHLWDLPWDDAPEWDWFTPDRDVRAPLQEVLALRRARQARVREAMASLTDERLDATVSRTDPGYPQQENVTVKHCLHVAFNEEWHHRLYAERDLGVLEARN